MDKLTLPIPDSGGPPSYDKKDLLFTRQSDGGFVLSLGTADNKKDWVRSSQAISGHRRMTSGRQWGVF